MSSKNSFTLEAIRQRAALLSQSGQLDKAADLYRKLLLRFPKNPGVLTDLGTLNLQLGDPAAGIPLLDRSLEIKPDQPAALCNRGIGLRRLGRFEEALASFDRALALAPDLAAVWRNRGAVLHDLQRFDESLSSCNRSIELDPQDATAHMNRGNALQSLKSFAEALDCYEYALKLNPGLADVHHNRCVVLKEFGRCAEALASCNRAIALNPASAIYYNTLGMVFENLGRLKEAIAEYQHATDLAPDLAEARMNTGMLLLLSGNFAEGWKLNEWRWHIFMQKKFVWHFPQPLWLGEPSLAGKTLLIHAEQGFGDSIQFCRFLPLLEASGARIVFEVPAPLVSLLATLQSDSTIVKWGDPLPEFDLHCPIMSLPLACKTTLASIPASVPYLYADSSRQSFWRQLLGSKTHLRVGLVWSGSTEHPNDRIRSIPFALLAPLWQLPVEFHVLQKDIREDAVAGLAQVDRAHMHAEELHDFADTAALVAEMDMVISVDTSLAHLAGALGKPVWILLPFVPDYRWLLDRDDSPWYPTATLFRQPAIGDWPSVIAEVRNRLEVKIKQGIAS